MTCLPYQAPKKIYERYMTEVLANNLFFGKWCRRSRGVKASKEEYFDERQQEKKLKHCLVKSMLIFLIILDLKRLLIIFIHSKYDASLH